MPVANHQTLAQGDISVAVHERLESADVRQRAGRFAGRNSHRPETRSDDLRRRLRYTLQVSRSTGHSRSCSCSCSCSRSKRLVYDHDVTYNGL